MPDFLSLTRNDWVFIIALFVTVFLAYYPAWQGGFLWDDNFHITRANLRSGYGLYRIWFDPGATQQYYPLLHSAFWLQSWFWGDSTFGYHLVNIFLNAMSAVMVALILRRLHIPGALLAAAIFALHPVHVESVAWISELKNSLSGFFYLGSFMVYLRYDEERNNLYYLCALALFVCALLSKTVTATLPAALLVIFWWRRGRLSWKKNILPLLPFFLLGMVSGILTIWVERTQIIGAGAAAFAMPFPDRILIAGKAIWFYLGKLFWPAELVFIYPRWDIRHAAVWEYLYPLAALALVFVLWALRRRWRGPLAGYLFFIGTLFPVLGFFDIFPFTFSFVADHFQYLASLGIIAPVAAGITLTLTRLKIWQRPAGYAVCFLILITLATLTWRQSRMYTDIETLYRTTIRLNPVCWMAHNNLGIVLSDSGRSDESIAYFQNAIRIKPDFAEARNNLAGVLAERGKMDEAIAHFQESLRIKPGSAVIHNNLAEALLRRGRADEAIIHFDKALQIRPDWDRPRHSLEVLRKKERSRIK